jgi:hypothetical protein
VRGVQVGEEGVMQSVWVVEHGCYSDRGVSNVFSSEQRAKDWIAIFAADAEKSDFSITELALDDPNGAWRQHPGMRPYRVQLFEKPFRSWSRYGNPPGYYGAVQPAGALARREDHDAGDVSICLYGGYFLDDYAPDANPYDWLVTSCWARDEEHAIKIASERRAALLANPPKMVTWADHLRSIQPVGSVR